MAEVRCPMCGKPNSDELDVCQFCQARLKPLIAPSDSGEVSPIEGTPTFTTKALSSEPEDLQDTVPDWLQSLRPESAEPNLSGKEEETADWLLANVEEEAETPEEEAESEQDWLSSLRPKIGVDTNLLGRRVDETWESPASNEDEIADWLKELRAQDQEATPPPAEHEAEPEWLERIRARQRTDETVQLQPDSEELPQPSGKDWTRDLTHEESLDQPPPSVLPTKPEDEIPSWLAGLGDTGVSDEPPDLPDWLKTSPQGTKELGKNEELPAWISGSVEEGASPTAELAPSTGEVEELPGWLASLEKAAALSESSETPPPAANLEDLSWLEEPTGDEEPPAEAPLEPEDQSEIRVVAPFTMDEETEAFITDELPDWLSGIPAQEAPADSGPPGDSEPSLTPAELPVWLQAIRPVEAVAPSAPTFDERDQLVEASGPLAGLRGILRAEPDIAQQKKPPTYSIKLSVPENHQSYAALMEDLLKSEGAAQPLPGRLPVSTQQVLRWVIFALLVISMIWPVWSNSQDVLLPQHMPRETSDARSTVDSLPDGAAVLVAVEYEPGLSAELDAASSSLIDHLMIKGMYLVFVSTAPSGPAQAERLVAQVNQVAAHGYKPLEQYANFGYIPGGAAGMLGLTESLRRLMPFPLNLAADGTSPGGGIWNLPQLAGFQKISDFAAVLVITDRPDTARGWVEQVQPSLQGKPMLMVVSAQAEPMVRPYYEGHPRQIAGMVTGLAGGAAYENAMPRTGLARVYWDTFSYGITGSVVLIIVGAAINILLGLLASRKRTDQEAQP